MTEIYMVRGQIFDIPVLVNWAEAGQGRPGPIRFDLKPPSHCILPDEELQKMQEGWAVIDRQGQDLPDFIDGFSSGSMAYTLLTTRARTMIEALDGAEWGFHDIRVWDKKADAQDSADPLVIWRVVRNLPTVDLEKSKIHRGTRGKGGPPFVALTALSPRQCVLLSGLKAPAPIWRDRDTAQVFCDESFKTAYEASGLAGLEFVGTTAQ